MKRSLPTLIVFVFSVLCYSQNETTKIESAKPSFETLINSNSTAIINPPSEKEKVFGIALENAIEAFLNKDYTKCIGYHEGVSKLNYFDPLFDYYAGISYLKLWQTSANKKYKVKSKKFLTSSKKHGLKHAAVYLKELKKPVTQYTIENLENSEKDN